MNVLLLGATGYIGGHIAENLITSGFAVSAFARSISSAQKVEERSAQPVLGDLAVNSQ